MTIRVNIKAAVNNASIRRETRNGREVIVVPSATMPDNVVMNRIFYPADEIAESFKSLNRTPAPLGHPLVNGNFISAREPEAINGFWVGAHNENVRRENGRVNLDKIVDVEAAQSTERGRKLLNAIERKEPIHTSTGIFLDPEPAENEEYDAIARNMMFDHDAILLDEEGAATPEQGVGMMVNGSKVDVVNSVIPNEDALPDSSDDFRTAMETALRERYQDPFVIDFNDEAAVFWADNFEYPQRIEYTVSEDGAIELGSETQNVEAQRSWTVVNRLMKMLGLMPSPRKPKRPDGLKPNQEGDNMPFTDEQRQELAGIVADQIKANSDAVSEAVGEAVKPLKDEIETLKANQAEAEQAKRTELTETITNAALLDEEDAKELSLNALQKLADKAKPGQAAPVLAAFNGGQGEEDKFWDEYDPYSAAREA